MLYFYLKWYDAIIMVIIYRKVKVIKDFFEVVITGYIYSYRSLLLYKIVIGWYLIMLSIVVNKNRK